MGKSRAEGAWSAKDTFAIPATKLRPAGFTRSASTCGRSVASLTASSLHTSLRIVQRIAPRMPPSGRIVTISGMDTHRYVAGHGILASAKAALEALTRYLAVELGPRGITVNAVNPGYVDTDSVAMYLADEAGRKAFFEEIEGATPLRALGQPEEVAALVAFLCSADAAWMQGQVLYLDGGVFRHAPGHSVRWWRQTGRWPR